jgi:hypothetical protein
MTTRRKFSAVVLVLIFNMILVQPLPAKLSLSAKITGGVGYFSGSDLNAYFKTLNEWDDYYQNPVQGKHLLVHFGSDFMAEFSLAIRPNLGIVLGVSRLGISRESVLTYGSGDTAFTETYEPRMNAIVISLGGFYALPLSKKLTLSASAAAAYYFGHVDYDYSDVDSDSDYHQTWEASKQTVGFQGGISLEYAVLPKLSLIFEAVGRLAALADLTGPYHYTSVGPTWNNQYDDERTAWTSAFVNDPTTTNSHLMLNSLNDDPNDYPQYYSNPRKASFSLSGMSLRLGARYKF